MPFVVVFIFYYSIMIYLDVIKMDKQIIQRMRFKNVSLKQR